MGDLIYADVTKEIRQAAFEVHGYFGTGFLEKVYENSLAYKLRKNNLSCQQQVPLKVYFEDNVIVGEYIADIVVDGKVIIEVKTVEQLNKIHFAQLMNYLRTTRFHLHRSKRVNSA